MIKPADADRNRDIKLIENELKRLGRPDDRKTGIFGTIKNITENSIDKLAAATAVGGVGSMVLQHWI